MGFFMCCADSLSTVPSTRLLEDAICRRFNVRNATTAPLDERACKADAVQSELAYLKGLLDTFEAAVGPSRPPTVAICARPLTRTARSTGRLPLQRPV